LAADAWVWELLLLLLLLSFLFHNDLFNSQSTAPPDPPNTEPPIPSKAPVATPARRQKFSVWGHSTQQRDIVDSSAGMEDVAAVGDDRLQKMARGH
jgi:hypothetical protein